MKLEFDSIIQSFADSNYGIMCDKIDHMGTDVFFAEMDEHVFMNPRVAYNILKEYIKYQG